MHEQVNRNIGKRDIESWPLEPGTYKLGNPYHPVAVFLPRSQPDLLKAAIESGAAIAGICYTANVGIEKVLINLISNSNLRWLIVVGEDNEGHKSGDAIINLWRNGVDPESRKIIGAKGASPYINNLPDKAIERFRKQFKIIDMLGIEDAKLLRRVIHGCIQEPWNKMEIEIKDVKYELYDPGAYPEPPIKITFKKIVEETGAAIEELSPDITVIRARTIGEAYPAIIRAIEQAGREYIDERGSRVKEVLNMIVHIEEPLGEPLTPKDFYMSREELDEYFEKLVLKPDKMGFEYTYGERLFEYPSSKGKLNQLEYLIQKLRKSPVSRRVIAVLWSPPHDLTKEEVPCITSIQFAIRSGRLHVTAYIRSNEMRIAWLADVYAIAKLSEMISKELKTQMGSITTISFSAHVHI